VRSPSILLPSLTHSHSHYHSPTLPHHSLTHSLTSAIPSPDNAKNHTPGFAHAARTETAHNAALRTAALLARTAFRVLADDAFCARVRAAYDSNGGGDDAAATGTGGSADGSRAGVVDAGPGDVKSTMDGPGLSF
jgi:hypothetical protein